MTARGHEVHAADRTKPTDETRRKLATDPLLRLEPDHQRAALEIERAYRLITAPVHMRSCALAARVGDFDRRRRPRDSEWTAGQSALVERYCDWIDELHRWRLPYNRVLDLVVDRLPCHEGLIEVALKIWLDGRRRVARKRA